MMTMTTTRGTRATVCAISLCSLLLSAQPTRAAEPTHHAAADVEKCRELESDAERLACFDRVFPRKTGDLLPAEPPVAEQSVEKDRDSKESSAGEREAFSLLDERWQLSPDSKEGAFHLKPYKPVYILAAFHASSTNETPSSPGENNTVAEALDLTNTETKFQISLKSKLWQNVLGDFSDLWFGYTQSSRWQTFNAAESRPFRETDYEPELMLTFRTNYELFGWEGRFASIGVNHQSNGRTEPLSRSWNRFIGAVGLERDGWTVMLRPWVRMHEDLADDDNPDIEDFMGRGDLLITKDWDGHEISAMFRHSLRGGDRAHSAIELDWAFPIRGGLSGYLQVFHGYGESLIDYNSSATFVGVGVSLVDWYARTRER
jgi:phospholipase A1